ncbi:MAG: 2-amino-3-ketobutyrate coenzyme A ligase [uncultured Cytophagales bacterium]|uniref:2-amino-3-ketobutyrate coenzyme A ligase n=1 Tax=uncultured Cytophagales bacterium TaxID=158755 RepID=A0A6J4HVJ8_9SPHI|nr:MAG: 2-amino-3-ketobutyrate coenzyme A ligase [uncultured Cytophagales bacterium]
MGKKHQYQLLIQSINEISTIARERGVAHLNTEDHELNGRRLTIRGKELLHFGSCGYLGLEMDDRLKEAAIDAIRRYGTQFSSSRTYVQFTLYQELEELLGQVFGTPALIASTTSQGHHAVMPIVVEDADAVILDQQAHVSMQDITSKLQVRGIPTALVRHSNLGELEKKIIELAPRHQRIWYCLDGVYSMYGDLAPVRELYQLMDKYHQFHLYVDDAHGMSWAGPRGSGYTLSQVPLHPRMILGTSLSKGFASAGAAFVIPDQELYWRVKNWGGSFTYSGPQQPALVGASIASARIHLSDEIRQRQESLASLVRYCNDQMKAYGLPVIMPSDSPIFFVGLGLTRVGYNMVSRLLHEGLYVNLGIFPAVPETCTGIRFTVTLHHTFADIDRLVERLAYHLPKALQEEGRSVEDIQRAFRSVYRSRENDRSESKDKSPAPVEVKRPALILQSTNTIRDLDQSLWDSLLGSNGSFDATNLALMEESFRDNDRPEDNWTFHYYIIKDSAGKPVVATFFTSTIIKDDMLAPAFISRKIEERRQEDFYYLTSRCLLMGSLITDGEHLYVDKSHPDWKNALMLLLDQVWAEQDRLQANALFLRDFAPDDLQLRDFFIDQGLVSIQTPDAHIVENLRHDSIEDYLQKNLKSQSRYRVRKDALEKSEWFDVARVEQASPEEADHLYALYENVHSRNLEINTFKLPKKLFANILASPHWDVITVALKPQYNSLNKRNPVAMFFSYRNANYNPAMLGLDYDYLEKVNLYKQVLLQVLNRALQLKSGKIYLGLTNSVAKRKFGAAVKPQVVYMQSKDNFKLSELFMENAL